MRPLRSLRSLIRRLMITVGLVSLLDASFAVPAQAQDRTLSWPDVTVVAHLDADGVLHVRERQRMRFSGEWNGGERTFDTRFGQRLEFDAMVRIDATGAERAMTRDDLDVVDGYKFTDDRTLRWRSRKADDAPFDNTVLTYELSFAYRDILDVLGGKSYRLNHDFAFADREGAFDHFALTLTIDSAWGVPADFTGHYETNNLEPGRSFVVTVPLTRRIAAPPSQVRLGEPLPVRVALLALMIGGMAVIIGRLFVHDKARGRFTPMPSPDSINEQWLKDNVFGYLPEVAGAAWDRRTAEPEVAATLARLVQEGKLRSKVSSEKVLMFNRSVLHLELLTSRDKLRPHERALIDALFRPKEQTTDTDIVRKRYQKTGFNPASVIRSALETQVQKAAPSDDDEDEHLSRVPTAALLIGGAALIIFGTTRDWVDGFTGITVLSFTLIPFLVARGIARDWQHRVAPLWPGALILSMLVLLTVGLYASTFVFGSTFRLGWPVLTGLVCWALGLLNSVANSARLLESPERVALRQRFAAARRYFKGELAKREPRLDNSWYPYLVAFGLGKRVDKWFKAFGGQSTSLGVSDSSIVSSSSSALSSTSSSGSSFRGFGGGGGFAGAGGGMDFGSGFGAAVSGMASSVPSPSSSSSGGSSSSFSSSSSSSSSGGGGGGGW